MNIKQFTIGTIVGAIVLFLLGFVVYAILLESFYSANAGSATGVAKENMNMPLLFVGNLAMSALLTYIYLQWAGISTFGTGFKAGFIVGLLTTLSWNLINFSTTNVMNLTGALVDVVVYALMIGITGGVIGLILGRTKK